MNNFHIYETKEEASEFKSTFEDSKEYSRTGAKVLFEGIVRNHNELRDDVEKLFYESHKEMAIKEVSKIFDELKEEFDILHIEGYHMTGMLEVRDIAVVIIAYSEHRADAFYAAKKAMDLIKERAPIWKKESYKEEKSKWINH